MLNKVIHGDCLIESEKIESGSVDLILTDLPYGNMKNAPSTWDADKTKWDTVIEPKEVYAIANRILRKNGKMVLFSQEPYTTQLINDAIPNVPFSYRAIWEKDTFANALGVNRNMVGMYEDILVFSKTHDTDGVHPLRPYSELLRAYIAVSTKEVNAVLGNVMSSHYFTKGAQFSIPSHKDYVKLIEAYKIDEMDGFIKYDELKRIDEQFKKDLPSTFNLWEGNKYKSNILRYKKDYDGYHPTQKPILLLEDLIKTFSNEGDLVVDLTCGSGSTLIAAKNTNRNYIGIELDEDYYKQATTRIEQHKAQLNMFIDLED